MNRIYTDAITTLTEQRDRIDHAIHALTPLAARNGGRESTAGTVVELKRGRRRMSAAGRRAIAEAQTRRWARFKRMKRAA